MSWAEFKEWVAFYELEPFGQEWEQTARTCAVVNWSQGGKAKVEQFLPVAQDLPSEDEIAARVEQQLMAMAKRRN